MSSRLFGSSALALSLAFAPMGFRPAEQDPSRWCNAPGSTEKPGQGRCGDDDAHCHRWSECRHYPPFTSPEDSEPPQEHGAHSGKCHDQGCQRHCDKDGCWPEQEQDRRPGQEPDRRPDGA
jgi:hypothetical protein